VHGGELVGLFLWQVTDLAAGEVFAARNPKLQPAVRALEPPTPRDRLGPRLLRIGPQFVRSAGALPIADKVVQRLQGRFGIRRGVGAAELQDGKKTHAEHACKTYPSRATSERSERIKRPRGDDRARPLNPLAAYASRMNFGCVFR